MKKGFPCVSEVMVIRVPRHNARTIPERYSFVNMVDLDSAAHVREEYGRTPSWTQIMGGLK